MRLAQFACRDLNSRLRLYEETDVGDERNREQRAASFCLLLVPAGACWCLLVPAGAYWCLLVPAGAYWCLLVPTGACWCLLSWPSIGESALDVISRGASDYSSQRCEE